MTECAYLVHKMVIAVMVGALAGFPLCLWLYVDELAEHCDKQRGALVIMLSPLKGFECMVPAVKK